MVVAVEYISKEESSDVAEGAASAQHGVTGILAVQGAFAEHAAILDRLGAPWKLLRAAEDFDDSIDRVILPGGESTTQGKLLRSTGLFEPIAAHIAAGKPVFGTCAGMILLAGRLDNDENVYFGALDAVVRRNAYGRQLGSFVATADFGASDDANTVSVMPGERVPQDTPSDVVLKDFPLVFIRGPFVAEVGPSATEATSSVDVESETLILQTIHALADRGKTVIMVTHRMANAADADYVVVFERGRVTEQDAHVELMRANGTYAKLFRTQQTVENIGLRNNATHSTSASHALKASDSAESVTQRAEMGLQVSDSAETDAQGAKTGVRMFDSAESDAKAMPTARVIARLLKEVGPQRKYMIVACVCGTLGHLAATFLPVFGVAAAFAAVGSPIWNLSVPAALTAMAVCALIRGGMRYAEQFMNHNVAFRLLALFRTKAFVALRRLAPAKLAGKGKGDLIALVTTDVELLEIFFAHTISPIVIAVVTTVVYTLALLTLSAPLAVTLVIAHLTVGVILPKLFASAVRGIGPKLREESAALGDEMLDDMRGIGEIIRFGQGSARLASIARRTLSLWSKRLRLSAKNGGFAGLGAVLVMLFTAIAAFLVMTLCTVVSTAADMPEGLIWMGSADSNAPALVAAFVLLVSSFGPTLALSALPANLTQTFASARRLFALMDEVPAAVEQGAERPEYQGMTMRDVTFGYDSSAAHPVLEHVSLDVPRHGILGIQGPSGRGKSTMLRLLMRYWDPDSGTISLSNIPLPQVDAGWRRRVQTMMGQETYLFDGTIRENLTIACDSFDSAASAIPDSVLREALAKASALELVGALPDGLDTQVGELGGRLSEGEKQRIGLARMFLRDADLVLFDEPTSRLDAYNESVILGSVNNLAEQGSAVVLVSHRDSTMRVADRILRM